MNNHDKFQIIGQDLEDAIQTVLFKHNVTGHDKTLIPVQVMAANLKHGLDLSKEQMLMALGQVYDSIMIVEKEDMH